MKSEQGINLKEGFVNYLKGRILSGNLKPGDRLPPERDLALQYGISRGSVNQGILDLERLGFLRIVPRKGVFVAEYVKQATPETLTAIMNYDSTLIDTSLFIDLMDMRILIEQESVRLACERMNEERRRLLSERMQNIYDSDEAELPRAIYEFHCCITGISGNAAYSMVFKSFEKMLMNLIEAHYSNKTELERCLPLYSQLTLYMCRADTEGANETISELLGMASSYLGNYLKKKVFE